MTLRVEVIGSTVDGSRGADYVLTVFIVVIVAVEGFPAGVGIGNSGKLEPAIPVVVTVFADSLVAYAPFTASCVDLHAVLDVHARMVRTGKSQSVHSGDTVADIAPFSAVGFCVCKQLNTAAAAVHPNKTGAVYAAGLCAAPNVVPTFVVRVERVFCKSRARAGSARGNAASAAYADAGDRHCAKRNGKHFFYLVHVVYLQFRTSISVNFVTE